MKNMLKNKTSLIIVCVFIGILICFFTMCNCRTNYSLIEGMDPSADTNDSLAPPPSSSSSTPLKDPTTKDSLAPLPSSSSSSTPLKGPTAKAVAMGVDVPAEPSSTSVDKKSKDLANGSKPSITVKDSFQVGREGFQRQRPIEYGSIQESKSDEWNLSKWVKDAMRYAKGMGNENRLDSYQYNTGPPIPLPEGELFFFKDTKFTPECCPGTYSSSLGCACLSKPQFNYLVTRGGNNTVPTGRKTAYYNEY